MMYGTNDQFFTVEDGLEFQEILGNKAKLIAL